VLLGGSVAVMAVWPFTHTPAAAMCLVLAVEGAGMMLVILGAYRRPGSETPLTWKAFTLAGLLDLRALSGHATPLLYAYPAFFVLMGSAVLAAIALGRRRARRAAGRLVLHPADVADSLITVCHEAHGAPGHWVLEAPRPRLAPSRPGLPAAAGSAPPAAALQPALPAAAQRHAIPAVRPVPMPRRAWPESDPGWPPAEQARPASDPAEQARPASDPALPAAGAGWPVSGPPRRVAGPAVPGTWRRHPAEAPPLRLAERRERAR